MVLVVDVTVFLCSLLIISVGGKSRMVVRLAFAPLKVNENFPI